MSVTAEVLRRRRGAHAGRARRPTASPDVGPGAPGRPLTTLSGGERQRLGWPPVRPGGGVYVLDADHRLHLADVEQLLGLPDRLTTPRVRRRHQHTSRSWRADWIVDLGPRRRGDGGGSSSGHTADLVAARSTLTGEHPPLRRRPIDETWIPSSNVFVSTKRSSSRVVPARRAGADRGAIRRSSSTRSCLAACASCGLPCTTMSRSYRSLSCDLIDHRRRAPSCCSTPGSQRGRHDVLRHRVELVAELALDVRPHRREPVVCHTAEEQRVRGHRLLELERVAFGSA